MSVKGKEAINGKQAQWGLLNEIIRGCSNFTVLPDDIILLISHKTKTEVFNFSGICPRI